MAVYPKIYQEMVARVLSAAYDPRSPKVDKEGARLMSMFTGQALDSGTKNLAAIQQAVQPTPPPPAAPAKQPKQRASRAPKFEHAPSLQTEAGRIQYKGG